jgi:hypothetical protein
MTGIFIQLKPLLYTAKDAYVLSNTTKGFSAIGNIVNRRTNREFGN